VLEFTHGKNQDLIKRHGEIHLATVEFI